MGYYIQTSGAHGKAKEIIAQHGAEAIDQPRSFGEVPEGKALICVADNMIFEAAAYCYSASEFEAFTLPEDHRPKQWLLMDLELAKEIAN